MINKRRVQRIRGFLYTCILLIILVPVILMLVVSFKTLTVLKQIDEHFFNAPPIVSDQQILESGTSGNAGANISDRELSSVKAPMDSNRSEPSSQQSDAADSLPLPESQTESLSSSSDHNNVPKDTLAEGGGAAPDRTTAPISPTNENATTKPYLDHGPNTGYPNT